MGALTPFSRIARLRNIGDIVCNKVVLEPFGVLYPLLLVPSYGKTTPCSPAGTATGAAAVALEPESELSEMVRPGSAGVSSSLIFSCWETQLTLILVPICGVLTIDRYST